MTGTVTDAGAYECEVCGKTFDSESALRRHLYEAGLVY